MMGDLDTQNCVPCRGNSPPITEEEFAELKQQIPDWERIYIEGEPRLQRSYKFRNFRQALAFTQKVGEAAEEAGHHPAILTEWGRVTVTWWTHAIGNLHRNDLIMAARSDRIASEFADGK